MFLHITYVNKYFDMLFSIFKLNIKYNTKYQKVQNTGQRIRITYF